MHVHVKFFLYVIVHDMQRRKDSVLLILSTVELWSVETQQQLSLQVLVTLKPFNVTWTGKDSTGTDPEIYCMGGG